MEQKRVVYYCWDAPDNEHPQDVMRSLAESLGFKIIGAVPQSIADQWWFWVEYAAAPIWPEFVQPASWLPIGTR